MLDYADRNTYELSGAAKDTSESFGLFSKECRYSGWSPWNNRKQPSSSPSIWKRPTMGPAAHSDESRVALFFQFGGRKIKIRNTFCCLADLLEYNKLV